MDDLQWADPSSLLTLGTLSRRLADLPVVLIACLRPSPHPPELERTLQALRAAGGRQVTLSQLDQQAVVELVTEAVAAQPGPGLLAEVAGARGNPLFVTELLAARLQEGAVQTVEGRAEVGGAEPATGPSPDDPAPPQPAARGHPGGPAVLLDPGIRLAQSGVSALRVAAHLTRGATQGDGDAIAWLLRAAREAAPSAPAVAAELLEQASSWPTRLIRPGTPWWPSGLAR